jgi:hypothetical protein
MRTTKTQLRKMVEFLQKQEIDISIHWAYGQPRCYTLDESRELSPRLTMGKMKWWLDGFESGSRAPRKPSLQTLLNEVRA